MQRHPPQIFHGGAAHPHLPQQVRLSPAAGKVQPGRLTRAHLKPLGGRQPPPQRQPLGPSPGNGLRPYRFRHPGHTTAFHSRGCSRICSGNGTMHMDNSHPPPPTPVMAGRGPHRLVRSAEQWRHHSTNGIASAGRMSRCGLNMPQQLLSVCIFRPVST